MNNINPILWGPHMWKSLHYITLSYPNNPTDETKNMFKDFFTNIIWKFLPCEKCRYNYIRHLKELPLTDEILNSRNKFIYWLVDIHNIVNDETGKRKISYEEFNNIYYGKDNTIKKKNTSYLYVILILVIILILLFITYKKMK
jgi:hypothetical protein